MKKVYILFFFFVSFVLYSERWVGHAATYQLMEGSVTSSGEVFSPQSFSAACNAFKIGAEIKILNASNGKTITVVINDRIKNNSGYFILLTPAAAKELGMEWQTGIVIVEGKFSDINSNEILDIEGLVSEREIDKELIKEFPEIKWPDETKEIDKNVKETPPQEEKDKIPDKKDIKSIDEEKIEKPKEEKTKIPEKKKNEIADNNDVSIKTKEKDKAPYDENITKIPQEKDKNISEDKEDINIPVKEKEKYPNKKEKGISEDREDINIPVKEKEKYPNKKEKGISEDREDINIPVKEKEKYPNKKEKGISDDKDDQNIPVKEKEKYPSKKEKGISDDKDDQNIPVKEKEKYPNKKEKGISEDREDINIPVKEKEKYPNKKEKGISDDKEDTYFPNKFKMKYPDKRDKIISEDMEEKKSPKKDYFKMPVKEEKKISIDEKEKEVKEKEKVIWNSAMSKGVYVRLLTSFDKAETDRLYRVFKEILPELVGLKDGNKYILFIGPFATENVNDVLLKVRKLGFKDAYIVKF